MTIAQLHERIQTPSIALVLRATTTPRQMSTEIPNLMTCVRLSIARVPATSGPPG